VKYRVAILLLLTLTAMPVMADAAGPLEGAWKIAEYTTTGGNNAGTNSSPQPGLYIFTGKHYSITAVRTEKPRPEYGDDSTDAERLAAFGPFTSNAGSYEIKGSTLTTRPLVAKSPWVMSGRDFSSEYRLEGKTLWLTSKRTDDAGQEFEVRTKLTRVE